MKRYFNYIALFVACLFATTACTYDDFKSGFIIPDGDKVTVMGRITPFTDYDVNARGVKTGDEGKLTSMAMALFPVNEDGTALDGPCEFFQYSGNQTELLFNIERGDRYAKNERYAMYIFANMPGLDAFQTKFENAESFTLDEILENCSYNVENIDIPENGFPMIGSLGDTFSTKFDPDGNVFILSPTDTGNDSGELVAPKVGTDSENLLTQTLLTIPMKALYAKINFTIEVRPEQSVEGNYSPQLTLEKYIVRNVPEFVYFDNSSNTDDAVSVLDEEFEVIPTGNKVASGANTINFSFYLPERMLAPDISADDYPYPFKSVDKLDEVVDKNQNYIRDEDEPYRQRYKSKLMGDAKKATHVVLVGRYRTHQNHYYDMEYTIHLGEDAFSNFNVKRNSEYNNIITIKGIQASDDMSGDATEVSIDHRVNIKHTQPAVIALRRETLLDSHFEVRPLRVRKSDIDDVAAATINAVKIEVVNPGIAKPKSQTSEGTWWIRLERSFGTATGTESYTRTYTDDEGNDVSIYINDDPNSAAYGKRKFFTYNLVNGLSSDLQDEDRTTGYSLYNNVEEIVPLSNYDDKSDCVWVYIDENTDTGDGVRNGVVRVTYGKLDGGVFTPTTLTKYPPVDYVFSQRNLFTVTYDERTYQIEYFEEYLYNFDAEDAFAKTDLEGMKWGLDGEQLSYDIPAILVSKGSWGSVDNAVYDALLGYSPYYDFYLSRDVDDDWNFNRFSRNNMVHDYAGHTFCKEIIQLINGGQKDKNNNPYDTDPNNNIDILQLDQDPDSAIEYCYNKNKRNVKGQVAWTGNTDNLNWYLPAIDEIEEIVMGKYEANTKYAYARFSDFQAKKYWSCQPAYKKNYIHVERALGDRHGQYMKDNTARARATSVTYNGQGADNPANYTKLLSEMIGFEKYIDADYSDTGIFGSKGLSNTDEKEVTTDKSFSGDNQSENWNHTIQKGHYDGTGALLRTEKARIRCVRKMN